MKRKLIKQGFNNVTITLPSHWVKTQQLHYGDEVDVVEKKEGLLIAHGPLKEKKFILTIKKSYSINLIRSLISSWYKQGYPTLELHFETKPSLLTVEKIINSFNGLEITQHHQKSFIISCFLNTDQESTEKLLIKFLHQIIYVNERLKEDWTESDSKELQEYLKQNIIKLRDQLLRNIISSGFGGNKQYEYTDFIIQLEKLTAEVVYLSMLLIQEKTQYSKTNRYESIADYIKEIMRCYLKKDVTTAEKNWLRIHQFHRDLINSEKIHDIAQHDGAVLLMIYKSLIERLLQVYSRLLSIIVVQDSK